jgi:tellurium resistance protein TerD
MAGISLQKGQGISLQKESPSVSKFYIALGWAEQDGVDPDVSAFLCKTDASGNPMLYPNTAATIQSEIDYGNLVFFNNPRSQGDGGAVIHVYGDNRNGKNAASRVGTPMADDDEAISVDTAKIDPNIDEISFVVTIDEVKAKGLSFENVRQSFIRICENDGMGREIARYKLDESFAPFTAVQFGSLLKKGSGWDFEAVGQGYGSKQQVVDFEAVVGQYLTA